MSRTRLLTDRDVRWAAKLMARVNARVGKRGPRPLRMEDLAFALGVSYDTLWRALKRVEPVAPCPAPTPRRHRPSGPRPTRFRCHCGGASDSPHGHDRCRRAA